MGGSSSHSFLTFVKNAFERGRFPDELNASHIALIDCQNGLSWDREPPTALCNVTYEIISQCIVNRLRPLLESIVGPFQSSFIPGRSTSDNIILAQEVISSMRSSKAKKGLKTLEEDWGLGRWGTRRQRNSSLKGAARRLRMQARLGRMDYRTARPISIRGRLLTEGKSIETKKTQGYGKDFTPASP